MVNKWRSRWSPKNMRLERLRHGISVVSSIWCGRNNFRFDSRIDSESTSVDAIVILAKSILSKLVQNWMKPRPVTPGDYSTSCSRPYTLVRMMRLRLVPGGGPVHWPLCLTAALSTIQNRPGAVLGCRFSWASYTLLSGFLKAAWESRPCHSIVLTQRDPSA